MVGSTPNTVRNSGVTAATMVRVGCDAPETEIVCAVYFAMD